MRSSGALRQQNICSQWSALDVMSIFTKFVAFCAIFRKLLTWLTLSWDTVVRRLSLTIVYLCLSVLIMQSCKASGDKLLQFSMLKIAQNSATIATCSVGYCTKKCENLSVTFDVTSEQNICSQNMRSRGCGELRQLFLRKTSEDIFLGKTKNFEIIL